jgi:DNA-binding CsgD family transcriptional regulator
MLYTLIASDSASLRSAACILLPNFELEVEVLFASNIEEIEAYLHTGSVKSAAIDPNLPGYGRDFDIVQLAHDFPRVRFSALSPVPVRQVVFETFEAALRTLPARAIPTVNDLLARADASPDPQRTLPLTARQTDVLTLLREGRSTKEIARRLGLAVPTVKTHLAALYRQLGARNRVEAVMRVVAPPVHRRAPHAAAFDGRASQRSLVSSA